MAFLFFAWCLLAGACTKRAAAVPVRALDLVYSHVPPDKDYSCSAVKDRRARQAWLDLRRVSSEVHLRYDFPWSVWHFSPFGIWWASRVGEQNAKDRAARTLTALPFDEDCVLGRWLAWLAGREISLQEVAKDRLSRTKPQRVALGRRLSAIISDVMKVTQALPPPLEVLAMGSAREPRADEGGIKFTLSDIGAASWHAFFAVARRIRLVIYEFIDQSRLASAACRDHHPGLVQPSTVSFLCAYETLRELHPDWARQPQLFFSTSEVNDIVQEIMLLNIDPANPGPTLSQKVDVTRRLEKALGGWTQGLHDIGLAPSAIMFGLFALDEVSNLFGALEQLWWPSAAVVRFPEGLYRTFRGIRKSQTVSWLDPRGKARPSACQYIAEGPLHGWVKPLGSVLFTNMTTSSGKVIWWRCGLTVRLMRQSDHVTSSQTWARSTLICATEVKKTLATFGLAVMAACEQGSCPRFRYVDVGANLGDCALAAVASVPEGSLLALAADGDPRVIQVLKETIAANGLDGVSVSINSSQARTVVKTKLALISDKAQAGRIMPLIGGGISTHGFNHSHIMYTTANRIPFATLDETLSDFGGAYGADVVSIFAQHGMEVPCLRGAKTLLRRNAVGCWLVMCSIGFAKCSDTLAWKIFEEHGYRIVKEGGWFAASPATWSGSVCSPPQWEWTSKRCHVELADGYVV